MLLRNYDNLMVAKTSIGYSKTIKTGTEFTDGQINVKDLSGTVDGITVINPTTKCCPLSYMSAVALGTYGGQAHSWFVIGQGTTKPTYDDYKLESKHSNSTFSIDTASLLEGDFIYNSENNTYSKTLSCNFKAKIDTTVSEIGIEHYFGQNSGDLCLVYREVLDEPVSVTAGQYITVSLTTNLAASSNKPADYQATVSIE